MRDLSRKLVLLATTACVSLALGDSFIWTGDGVDDNWNNGCNWGSSDPCGGHPDGVNDYATFPYNSGNGWDVDQKTHTIARLIIEGDVAFNYDATLKADTILFQAGDGQILVTVAAGKIIGHE
jgi:hypothetical protein